MSRCIAFFLLALLAFRSTGFLLFSLTRIHTARVQARAMRQHDPASGTETFVFALSHYRTLARGNREFWWEGRLFDVIHTARQGDSICVQARPDRFEQGLVQEVKSMFQNPEPAPPGAVPAWWAQLFAPAFLPATEALQPIACRMPAKCPAPCMAGRIPREVFLPCAVPPPEYAFPVG